MSDATQRLSISARKIIDMALREALACGKNAIEPEHIATALSRKAQSDHAEVCAAFEVLRGHFAGGNRA